MCLVRFDNYLFLINCIVCFSLSNQNELSLKIYLTCVNIEKKNYLVYNDNGNWINQTNFEKLQKALYNNDAKVSTCI